MIRLIIFILALAYITALIALFAAVHHEGSSSPSTGGAMAWVPHADIKSTGIVFKHTISANYIHRFASCPMPDEDEWLLDSTTYHAGTSIPRYLHKVILTTQGGFPEYVPEILNMMNDDEYNMESYGRDDWIGSIEEIYRGSQESRL